MSSRRKKDIDSVPDEVYRKVIEHLENGGTKKAACEMLGVGSNPTMERMVEEWQERQIQIAEMKKKKRGTKIEGVELASIIEQFLQGDSLQALAERHYRSTQMIKSVLEQSGALLKEQGSVDPLNPPTFPDECVKEVFEVDELVWVPGYQCIGVIKKALDNPVGAYRIWLLSEANQQNVHLMNYDIASVSHLKELGVDVKSLGYEWSQDEVITIRNEALRAALKREKEFGSKK